MKEIGCFWYVLAGIVILAAIVHGLVGGLI